MSAKIVTFKELAALSSRLKSKKKKIVFTNGSFDILHLGHTRYLQQARKQGDVLVVGVNSDASVRAYKGPGRPLNPQKDRLEVLAALECVDYAVLFSEPTPIRLITRLKPDVLVKGADWKKSDIVGGREIRAYGGKICRIALVRGRSTTHVIDKIVKAGDKVSAKLESGPTQSAWKLELMKHFRLYAVTDLREPAGDILQKINAAYRGGADIVQLRSHALSDALFVELGLKVRRLADRYKKLFMVNNRPDLALLTHADGIHLGQDDLSIRQARGMLAKAGVRLFVGKSTHTLDQARQALKEDVDYISVGPIFSTPTKPAYSAVGLGLLQRVKKLARIPVVAIGGIDSTNLKSVLAAGADRVAVVRAIFEAGDSYEAVQRLRNQIDRHAGRVR